MRRVSARRISTAYFIRLGAASALIVHGLGCAPVASLPPEGASSPRASNEAASPGSDEEKVVPSEVVPATGLDDKQRSVESETTPRDLPNAEDLQEGCRTRKQVEASMDFEVSAKVRGTVAVVDVAFNDSLNVRQGPSPRAKILKKLPYAHGDLRVTGRVCQPEKDVWFQLRIGDQLGWVNGKYLVSATTERTKEVSRVVGERAGATPEEIAERFLADLRAEDARQIEGRHESKVTAVVTEGRDATVRIHRCCALDDSVSGEIVKLKLVRTGPGWVLDEAFFRMTCYRGTTDDGTLCL